MVQFTLLDVFKKHDVDQTIEPIDNLEELARAQQKIEHHMTKIQAAKAYKAIIFYAAVIIWTAILVGYENQAGGMVLSIPQFREDFGYEYNGEYVLPADWQSAITGGATGALAIGALVGSWFSDRFGKRRTILFASILSVPFITVEYIAVTIEIFFMGKFVNAFFLGILVANLPAYTSEISPMALRGFLSAFIALSLCIGPFICVLINNTTSTYTTRMAYRGIFIPQWVFAGTSILGICFIPESPYWLISKGRDKDAMKALNLMYNEDIKSQYALMKITVDEAAIISSQAGTYLDCFKRKDLKRTLLVVFSFVMQAMCGVAYVASYSTYYFQLSGFDTQKSFQISCGAQALSVSGVIASFFIIDRFGRRPLMLWGMIGITALNFIIAGSGIDTSNATALKVSSAFMAMYNFFYNIGIGPLPYILGNELSSVFLRAKTISLASFLNNAFQCMWGVVLPYMFNPDQANMGSSINFIFGGMSLLSIFVFYFFLPECSHRSFEEIDEMFAAGVPARHWVGYKTDKEIRADEILPDTKADVEHLETKLVVSEPEKQV